MEKNMILQDKAKELDRLLSSDQQKIQRKLVREMNTCISELQSLIEICMDRAQGQDPNISVLLGVRGKWFSHLARPLNHLDTFSALQLALVG
jgi:centrosomal protein CEP85